MVTMRVPEAVLRRIDITAARRVVNRTQLLIGPYVAPPDCPHGRATRLGLKVCPKCGEEVHGANEEGQGGLQVGVEGKGVPHEGSG